MSDTSTRASGLQRFGGELDPGVVESIAAWADDPELGKLHASLQAIRDREKFHDTFAEALAARHLLARGCALRVEVDTPAGRSCDFEVACGRQRFYLHVKRLNTDKAVQRRLSISSRLRYLERIARPYVVSVHVGTGLRDEQMQRYVTEAAAFITHARVGDEIVIRDDGGRELGSCRIVAPRQGARVSLVIGLPDGFIDEAPRIRRLLRKAYRQFMPGAVNVILICTSHADDTDDFANALLGSHIERWDAHPPRGRRVAHGRDVDGFWHGRRFPESQAAGWFHFRPDAAALHGRMWIRRDAALEPPVRALLARLFDSPAR